LRQFVDLRIGLIGLRHGRGRDPPRFRHLAADFRHRGHHLFAGRGRGLHAAGRLFGCRRNRCGKRVGRFRRPGEPVGCDLDVGGGGGDRANNLADRRLETGRDLEHHLPALGFCVLLCPLLVGGQLPVLDELVLEHRERVRDLADFVAARDPFDGTVEFASREMRHRVDHLDQRRGQPSAEPQRRRHHRRHREADRPEHVAPQRGQLSPDGGKPLVGRVAHAVEVRTQPLVDLGEVLGLFGKRALTGHEGKEARLVAVDQL